MLHSKGVTTRVGEDHLSNDLDQWSRSFVWSDLTPTKKWSFHKIWSRSITRSRSRSHFINNRTKVSHYTIWSCLIQQCMHFKERIDTNDKWRRVCANFHWKQNISFDCLISNRATQIPKYDLKVIFRYGDPRSKIKINCKRSPVVI